MTAPDPAHATTAEAEIPETPTAEAVPAGDVVLPSDSEGGADVQSDLIEGSES